MNEVLEFIEAKTPIIQRELNDLKAIVRKGEKHDDSIYTHIVILEMRLNDLQSIKKMLT